MYKVIYQALMVLLLGAITVEGSYAQIIAVNDKGEKTAAENLEIYYNKAIGQQSKLFNGPYYQFYLPQITGSAYFKESQKFTNGSVIYDNFLYENVPLLYDLYRDLIISMLYDGNSKFSLVSEKVAEFVIDGHRFIYINKNTDTERKILPNGFYDLLYLGKLKILVKRGKSLQEVNEAPYVRKFFVTKNSYFLEKDNVTYTFSKEGSFLSLFKKDRSEMRKHLKKNNIRFKDNPEQAMVLLAHYYDSLPN